MVLAARQLMDELIVQTDLPRYQELTGQFSREQTGGVPASWRARLEVFERPPGAGPGSLILERIQLEVNWGDGDEQGKRFVLETYRINRLREEDLAFLP